jgi:hypothetical protein
MRGNEIATVSTGLFIDEIVDVALAIDGDVLGLVAGDRRIAHELEQRVQFLRSRMRVFDKLETIGAHRIVGANRGGRCIVRKRTHGGISQN